MPDSVTAQESALTTVLATYSQAATAAAEYTAIMREKPYPAGPDQMMAFTQLRAAVRGLCEAARGYVEACGSQGPDNRVWSGATPPHEMWLAAQITMDSGFFEELEQWDAHSAAVLAGDRDDAPGRDPAGPIKAACSRALDFRADKDHDAMLAAAETLEGGRRTVTAQSIITPGGGRRTTVTLGPLDPGAGPASGPAALSWRPQWWIQRQNTRARRRRDRTVYRWARRNLLHRNPHDSALALVLRGWLQIADPDTVATQSWYACYFIAANMRALGYPALVKAVDIEFRSTTTNSDTLPAGGRHSSDLYGPPQAAVILLESKQLLDPTGGKSMFQPDIEPILRDTETAITPGDTVTTMLDEHTQLIYTLTDRTPVADAHDRQACAAINQLIADNVLSPKWDPFRAQ